jgi:hypothetical protein
METVRGFIDIAAAAAIPLALSRFLVVMFSLIR